MKCKTDSISHCKHTMSLNGENQIETAYHSVCHKHRFATFLTGKASVFFMLLCMNAFFAQTPDFSEQITISLWAELDAYPGLEKETDVSAKPFEYPIATLKKIAPYLLNGMIYGWSFEYTPLDKLRAVKESFAVSGLGEIQKEDGEILYTKPWIENNRLYCWVEFSRTPTMMWHFKRWNTINIEKIKGRGYAPVSIGFEGIQKAAEDALKNGLREYYRGIEKNKPKEIDGRVLICSEPKIGIKSGRYVVELDFFLETDRIVKYSQF